MVNWIIIIVDYYYICKWDFLCSLKLKIIENICTSCIICIIGFFRLVSYQFFFCVSATLTHHYNTWDNRLRRIEHLGQENKELKDEIARLTMLMESVIAAQNQSSKEEEL